MYSDARLSIKCSRYAQLYLKYYFLSIYFLFRFSYTVFFYFQVPTFAYEKRLSRIETLRLAITYIAFMGELLGLDSNSPKQEYIPREYYLPN